MQIRSLRNCRLFQQTSLVVLCFCILLLSTPVVRAQKAPSIFKDGSNGSSTSAESLAYIRSLEEAYKTNVTQNNDLAKLTRNRLIFIAVEQIDTVFNDYRRKSRTRNDLIQFLFDFLEIGASTAIAITNSSLRNGARSKVVIAEALTGFKGVRTALNKDLRLLEAQILFNKMEANRAMRLGQIYSNLDQDVVQYPWERARSELKGYFFAGTIDDALNSLSIDAGSQAQSEEKKLASIKENAGIVGAPTQEQRNEAASNFDAVRTIIASYDKASSAADKKKILNGLRSVYLQIEADPKLSPLPDKIPERQGLSANAKARLENSLRKLKANDNPDITDYESILLGLSGVISSNIPKDSTLAGRLKTILSTFKPKED